MFRGLLIPTFLLAAGSVLLWSCTSEPGSAASDRLQRGTFHVSIQERLENRKTQELEETDVNVSELLVTRKLVHHGFQPVTDPSQARYIIEGTLDAAFHKELSFDFQGQKTLLEHQYKAVMKCSIKDTQNPDAVEHIDIPEMINGRNKEEIARLDIRRRPATIVAQRMVQGKLLGRQEIIEAIRELGYVQSDKTFNDCIQTLVEHGSDAIPYVLELLYDERVVKLPGKYPGLEEWNKESLRYYHIADKVLTELLERDSALALDSSELYVRNVRIGWTWVWEDKQGIPAEYREREEDRKSTVKAGTQADPGKKPPALPEGDDDLADPAPAAKPAADPKPATPETQPRIGSQQ